MDEECIYDKRLVGFNKKSYGKYNRKLSKQVLKEFFMSFFLIVSKVGSAIVTVTTRLLLI